MKYKDMRADTHLSDCLDTELSNQLSSTYIQFGLCHVFLSHFLRLAVFLSCTWELLVSMQPHRLNWFWKISNNIVLFLIVPCCRAGCKHLLIFFFFFLPSLPSYQGRGWFNNNHTEFSFVLHRFCEKTILKVCKIIILSLQFLRSHMEESS